MKTVSGADLRYDGGLSMGLALWGRSAVLIELGRGEEALVDIQQAIENGLGEIKKKSEYFVRLAKAYARECEHSVVGNMMKVNFNRLHFSIASAVVGDKCKLEICLNLAKRLSNNPEEFGKTKAAVEQIEPSPVADHIKSEVELSQLSFSRLILCGLPFSSRAQWRREQNAERCVPETGNTCLA